MLYGFQNYAGVKLLARHALQPNCGEKRLCNGKKIHGLTITNYKETLEGFIIDVPTGASELTIRIYGGTGDADLYVKHGGKPTKFDYDYRPMLWGNSESVEVFSPKPGKYYVMLRSYDVFADVTLEGSFVAAPIKKT